MDRVDVGRSRDALDRHLSVAPMWLPKALIRLQLPRLSITTLVCLLH
jgi:hypothetical protein